MAAPTYTPGQVLGAADCNSWFTPLAAYKAADQSVTSSTVLVNDTALVVPVAASATYWIDFFFYYEGGTQGSADFKWGWTFPAGLTMRYAAGYLSTGGTWQGGGGNIQTAVNTAGSNGPGTVRTVEAHGTVLVASTAGNLQLQFAQGTSNATATILHASSALFLYRIA